MDYQEKCPHCGKSNNVIGRQQGYGCVEADKVLTLKSQSIYHVICLECGTVIRSFVKKPKKLVIKNK